MLGWLFRTAIATALIWGTLYVAGFWSNDGDSAKREATAAAFKSCPAGAKRKACQRRRDLGLGSEVSVTINVYEYGFQDSKTVIKTGQAVRWVNVGQELHELRPSSLEGERVFKRAFRLGTSRHVFDRPGTYEIYCSIHPDKMRSTVVVEP